MSTPQQPPRRRRIAGERRPTVQTGSGVEDAPVPSGRPTPPTAPPAPPAEPPRAEPPPQDTGPDDTPPRRAGWWGSRASLVALTLTLVALLTLTGLGLAGLLGNRGLPEIREAARVQDAEETAPSVAERAAEAILAYDHRSLDADRDAAERFMTSGFAEKYSDSFTKVVAPAARTYKAQVTAEVLGSAVVRAEEDRVKVLVFVNQTTVATNKKNPQQALNRVEFDLVRRGGSWLVDEITSY